MHNDESTSNISKTETCQGQVNLAKVKFAAILNIKTIFWSDEAIVLMKKAKYKYLTMLNPVVIFS